MECAIGALLVIANPSSYGYIYSETRCQIHTEQLPQEEVQRIKNDRKAATTLVIILIALMITLSAIIIVSVTTSSDTILPPGFRCVIWCWGGSFAILGSLSNPIVYCWRMKNLRHAFLEILHLRQPENTLPGTEMKEFQRSQLTSN